MTKLAATPQTATEISSPAPLAPEARLILRGVQRLLRDHGFESLAEVVLGNGRRADAMAIGPNGEIWIVEIKSSIADFRSDSKWPGYRDYCDRLYFAVAPDFPIEILPQETGLILADRYGGDIRRDAPEIRLAGARRKAITIAFARVGAARLLNTLETPLPAEPAV